MVGGMAWTKDLHFTSSPMPYNQLVGSGLFYGTQTPLH